MQMQDFEGRVVEKGLVSSEKTFFSFVAIDGPPGDDGAPRPAVVFSLEAIGYPKTKREVSCLLSDDATIESALSQMAESRALFEAMPASELASIGNPPRRRR